MIFVHFLLEEDIAPVPPNGNDARAWDGESTALDQRLRCLILLPDGGHATNQPARHTSDQARGCEERLRMKACPEHMVFHSACQMMSFHTAVQR